MNVHIPKGTDWWNVIEIASLFSKRHGREDNSFICGLFPQIRAGAGGPAFEPKGPNKHNSNYFTLTVDATVKGSANSHLFCARPEGHLNHLAFAKDLSKI